MKNPVSILLIFLFLAIFFSHESYAQGVKVAPEGFKYFEMPYGDSTIVMREYYLCFLKSGPNRDHSEEESAKIQAAHLEHLASLAEEGYTAATGPLGSDGDIRGIVVFNVASLEKAKKLAEKDPAVIAGRLIVEIHPWWAMRGATLP